MPDEPRLRIGCAGWSIPAAAKEDFAAGPSHLARYATRFTAVEINSSFYRPHRRATYVRWAESTPAEFRFSVKVPRRITHELRLAEAEAEFAEFIVGPHELGRKLGALLAQLPPNAEFDRATAAAFFRMARRLTATPIASEPRHRSWFDADAERLLVHHAIGRVAADPACLPTAAAPAGDPTIVYYRLHGSPKIYYSAYDDSYLRQLAARLAAHRSAGSDTWCIFDNTALGAATTNGLALGRLCR